MKTIIATNGSEAVFNFDDDGFIRYVVGTLIYEDRDKKVGDKVAGWVWGHYGDEDGGLFKTPEEAIKWFEKTYGNPKK